MKKHQVIFEKIKELLKKHFGEEIKEYEEGTILTIGYSGVLISSNDRELTIGYGMTHTNYDPDYDDIGLAIDRFFNLLTKRKRITEYLKGNFSYKNKTEIELDNSEYDNMGISMTWLFPYWKRTKEKISFRENLIDRSIIEDGINQIKTMHKKM